MVHRSGEAIIQELMSAWCLNQSDKASLGSLLAHEVFLYPDSCLIHQVMAEVIVDLKITEKLKFVFQIRRIYSMAMTLLFQAWSKREDGW